MMQFDEFVQIIKKLGINYSISITDEDMAKSSMGKFSYIDELD